MKEGYTLIHKTYKWNEQFYCNRTYIHPETKESFDLSHMAPKTIKIKYEYNDGLKKKIKGEVYARVIFSHHCYTKAIQHNENKTILITEYENGVTKEHRAFDQLRYKYTFILLEVIVNISYKICRESRLKGKLIRLEEKDKNNPHRGIYIIMKLKVKKENLFLHIETAHYRNNEPFNIQLKKESRRFMLILGDMLKNDWNYLIS
ncbi:hypothetical protein [Xenorhabdus miraniensis]|uniref:Uncharacterized protein n=1 Tax=Xenorhabdus miraniensis TaxID=351674 RepID=A0A2D0JVI9_9GAMM|nr:hypothetical protein [Xenorhabdus miraniensis]PHM50353.1 hypothetical protein Xmir_00532 [Xenorhabdus miraniensis]